MEIGGESVVAPHTLPTAVETAWSTGCCWRKQKPSCHLPAGKETTLVEHLLCAGHTHSSQQSCGAGTIVTPIVHLGKRRQVQGHSQPVRGRAGMCMGSGRPCCPAPPALPSRAHQTRPRTQPLVAWGLEEQKRGAG